MTTHSIQQLLLSALFILPSFACADGTKYPINFDADQNYTHGSRRLRGIILKTAAGTQHAEVAQNEKVYNVITSQSFSARAGENVTASFDYAGTWMHGFIYLDRGNDGAFDAELNADGTYAATSDIMAFSCAKPDLDADGAYNSKGETITSTNVLQPPSFTIPAELSNGFYRMRYKVDWADINPGGRMTQSNSIIQNGGAICDIFINVHGDSCDVSITELSGGSLAYGGKPLTAAKVPFGKDLTLEILPEDGKQLINFSVRHGYNLDGEQFVDGVQQYEETVLPAFLVKDGKITLPAGCVNGDVRISATFGETDFEYENYECRTDDKTLTDTEMSALPNIVGRITATAGSQTSEVVIDNANLPKTHRLLLDRSISAKPGEQVTLQAYDKEGNAVSLPTKSLSLYVDLNEDGHFDKGIFNQEGLPVAGSELIGNNHADASTITFTVNELMPCGNYRVRLVAGKDEASETTTPAIVTDFMLNVHNASHKLCIFSTNGSVHGSGVSGLPDMLAWGESQMLRPVGAATGYIASRMTIRHGHRLDGPQFVSGNKQWSEYSVPANDYTLPADSVDGDVHVTVNFFSAGSTYSLVFNDEFNGEDGELPSSERWVRCPRYSSTWNRWLSITDEEHAATGFIEDGKFVALSLPNPFRETDDVPMITGGIKTMGKFAFTYGKVECRAKANPWTGNFPAIWLMPEDQSAGWPNCGEIDIWEVIDKQNTTYHTVHSNWTHNLGQKSNPTSSFNKAVPQDTWHTFGVEWDATSIKWYVDGVYVGTYTKSTSTDALSKGQWPFDKDFHIILNQSVGNASWAANADVNHTYRTDFDWVRVYQLEGQTNTAITPPTIADQKSDVVYDLSGRIISQDGKKSLRDNELHKGIYIMNGKKFHVK